jgi:hypothetical protein
METEDRVAMRGGNVSLYFITLHDMTAYRRGDAHILNITTDEGEWSASHHSRLSPGTYWMGGWLRSGADARVGIRIAVV